MKALLVNMLPGIKEATAGRREVWKSHYLLRKKIAAQCCVCPSANLAEKEVSTISQKRRDISFSFSPSCEGLFEILRVLFFFLNQSWEEMNHSFTCDLSPEI